MSRPAFESVLDQRAKLKLRAESSARLREFFAARGVIEVDTPVLAPGATPAPYLQSFITRYHGPGYSQGRELFLHTSPEFAMKRLLATGSGCIYQLAKVFRNGELGRYHQPEFTLLEWYRVGYDYHELMAEVAELVQCILAGRRPVSSVSQVTYQALFEHYTAIDPHRTSVAELQEFLVATDCPLPAATMAFSDTDGWLDLVLTQVIEPQLEPDVLVFVYDYPVTQAALAAIRPGSPAVAERFELYFAGVELANGFHELADPLEQRQRFEAENRQRLQSGLAAVTLDERFLQSLATLPDCSGVALGFDRLLMIAANHDDIAAIVTFSFADI